MPNYKDEKPLKCSFCGKPQNRVRKLIAGPGVYICDECIGVCTSILEDELDFMPEQHCGQMAAARPEHLPTPQELKDVLDQYVARTAPRSRSPLPFTTTTSVSTIPRPRWSFRSRIS